MRKFTVGSDLHLEFGRGDLMFPGGDILVLAGDICLAADFKKPQHQTYPSKFHKRNQKFFEHVSEKYNEVVYVFGNHEFYQGDITEAYDIMRKALEKYPNIHILENETVTFDDVVFAGTTLWTSLNNDDWFVKHAVKDMINDFIVIANKGYRFSVVAWMDMHKQAVDFIRKTAYDNQDKKVVVVTHHGPTTKSIGQGFSPLRLDNWAYVSDLSDIILDNPNIKYWVHGHTHTRHDYMVGDTRVLCNPRGYYGEQHALVNSFDTDLTVEV